MCADGYYSLGRQASCTGCPPGYSCDDETKEPIICELGKYSTGLALTCTACNAGFACAEGSKSAGPADGLCSLGYYCPDGKDPVSCPKGLLFKWIMNIGLIQTILLLLPVMNHHEARL